MFFWKTERQVQQRIEEYLRGIERCLDAFDQAFNVYFAEGLNDALERLVDETHHLEQAADSSRREIEAMMYNKALIPESRGDVLGMLEALDLIPNKCESVLYQIWMQNMTVPEEFADKLRALVATNVESCRVLCQAMRDLFSNVRHITEAATGVAEKEGQSDVIERQLIKAVFDSDLDKADKILLKELVLEIGAISDRAENAADRLRNIAIKRQS